VLPEAGVNWGPSKRTRSPYDSLSRVRGGSDGDSSVRCILPAGALLINVPSPRRAVGNSGRLAYQAPRCRKLTADQGASIRALAGTKSLRPWMPSSVLAMRRSEPWCGKVAKPDLTTGRTTARDADDSAPGCFAKSGSDKLGREALSGSLLIRCQVRCRSGW